MADTLNEGRIIKGISGFYYVKAGEQIIECKARGIFRNRGLVPYAGDKVRFDLSQKIIEEILPRKNYFVRPPIANVDNFIIVLSTIMPRPDYYLIDKLTGYRLRLIDAGGEAAVAAKEFLEENGLLSSGQSGKMKFFVTDKIEGFTKLGKEFLGEELCNVTRLDPEELTTR